MVEREIGKILGGIEDLKGRYTSQEGRLTSVEGSLSRLHSVFAAQPARCLSSMESKFATKESLKPLESTNNIIKKAAIYVFCGAVAGLAVVLVYIRS